MQDSFFTGKPHVGEMGYVFLFRAYRADQGKWNSQDPVALAVTLPTAADFRKNSSFVKALGYPDGWNNLAYVNNNVIMYVDWSGCEWVLVNTVDTRLTSYTVAGHPETYAGYIEKTTSYYIYHYNRKKIDTTITGNTMQVQEYYDGILITYQITKTYNRVTGDLIRTSPEKNKTMSSISATVTYTYKKEE